MESIHALELVSEEHLLRIEESPRVFPGIVHHLAQEIVGNDSQENLLSAMRAVRDHLNSALTQRRARIDQVHNMTANLRHERDLRMGRR